MEHKNLKVLLPTILIVVLVAIFLLSQLGAGTSKRVAQQDKNAPGKQTQSLVAGELPQAATPVSLGNLSATPVTGNVDDIISDVLASFSDDAAIASEGNADAALVTTDNASIKQVLGDFDENHF